MIEVQNKGIKVRCNNDMSVVNFKLDVQSNSLDNSQNNTRTVCFYQSSDKLPAGWGWLDLVARFCGFKMRNFQEITADHKKKVIDFASEDSETYTWKDRYEKIVQLLTHDETWPGNLPGSIKYGIYDLCLDVDYANQKANDEEKYDVSTASSEYFLCTQILSLQENPPIQEQMDKKIQDVAKWVRLAIDFKNACEYYLSTYKECAKYEVMREQKMMPVSDDAERVTPDIANFYTDKDGKRKAYINFPRLLKALHENHFLFSDTKHQIAKLLQHSDHYEAGNHHVLNKFRIAICGETGNLNDLAQSYIECAKNSYRVLLALEQACHFVTTAALALVEDGCYAYARTHHLKPPETLKTLETSQKSEDAAYMLKSLQELLSFLTQQKTTISDPDNLVEKISEGFLKITTENEKLYAEIKKLETKLKKNKEVFLKNAENYDKSSKQGQMEGTIESKKSLIDFDT